MTGRFSQENLTEIIEDDCAITGSTVHLPDPLCLEVPASIFTRPVLGFGVVIMHESRLPKGVFSESRLLRSFQLCLILRQSNHTLA